MSRCQESDKRFVASTVLNCRKILLTRLVFRDPSLKLNRELVLHVRAEWYGLPRNLKRTGAINGAIGLTGLRLGHGEVSKFAFLALKETATRIAMFPHHVSPHGPVRGSLYASRGVVEFRHSL